MLKRKPSAFQQKMGILTTGGKEKRICGVYFHELAAFVVVSGYGGSSDSGSSEGRNRQNFSWG
jgi:hypothetical protein